MSRSTAHQRRDSHVLSTECLKSSLQQLPAESPRLACSANGSVHSTIKARSGGSHHYADRHCKREDNNDPILSQSTTASLVSCSNHHCKVWMSACAMSMSMIQSPRVLVGLKVQGIQHLRLNAVFDGNKACQQSFCLLNYI